MKYKDTEEREKNRIENGIENDDMNIQSHLNTSLDLSGISVSEDLINRTLAAIAQQPAENQSKKQTAEKISKKAFTWNRYTRGFAGIAAAALVAIIGYGTLTHLPVGKEKSANNQEESQVQYSLTMEAADQVTEGTTSSDTTAAIPSMKSAADTNTEATNDEAAADSSAEYGVTADSFETATGKVGATNNTEASEGTVDTSQAAGTTDTGTAFTTQDSSENTGTEAEESKISATLKANVVAAVTFRDIFLPNPKQAEYIKITEHTGESSVTLTEQADILDVYSVLDSYRFTAGTGALTEQSYTIEGKSLQNTEQYVMTVGNVITIRYQNGDNVVETIYDEAQVALLKQSLKELILKFNQKN